jgi:predicted phosphodiesterase
MKPARKLFSIGKEWKKIMAVGCSHGNMADPKALDAVCNFRDAFNPDVCIHLGDSIDTAAFRSGAQGTPDESEDIEPDLESGFNFIERFEPNVWLMGNHEDRLWRLAEHPSAIVAKAARDIIKDIYQVAGKLHAKVIPYLGIWNGVPGPGMVEYGRVKYLHGIFYSENASRDHAERFGTCCHAHTHKAGITKGRRGDNPTAYCPGWLGLDEKAGYAKTRASTLAWSKGWVWGFFREGKRARSQLYLHEQPRGETEWVLPL